MDENVSYNFGLIDSLVRREIHATTARLNASLTDLRSRIAPLRASWTRETATAFGIEQDRWDRAAAGLSFVGLFTGLFDTVQVYVLHAVADTDHASIITSIQFVLCRGKNPLINHLQIKKGIKYTRTGMMPGPGRSAIICREYQSSCSGDPT